MRFGWRSSTEAYIRPERGFVARSRTGRIKKCQRRKKRSRAGETASRDHGCRDRSGLRRAAARRRIRQALRHDRVRPLRPRRSRAYRARRDPTGEVSQAELARRLAPSPDDRTEGNLRGRLRDRRRADPGRRRAPPRLSPLVAASATVGRHLKKGAIVVYESTVYPGATEEVCIPCSSATRACVEAGLPRRLFARADQPGRQGAHAHQDPQGRLRR